MNQKESIENLVFLAVFLPFLTNKYAFIICFYNEKFISDQVDRDKNISFIDKISTFCNLIHFFVILSCFLPKRTKGQNKIQHSDNFSFVEKQLHANFLKITLNGFLDNVVTNGLEDGWTDAAGSIGSFCSQPGTDNELLLIIKKIMFLLLYFMIVK